MQTLQNSFSSELMLRLVLAMLAGIVLGLNRWLHHKSAGIRTHSLVSLGAAVAMLLIGSMEDTDTQASSRVLQGLLAGIGFLGAGVIIRENNSKRIHGLTTAASLWACALLGASFGAGLYALGILALLVILFVLIIGGSLERLTGAIFGVRHESEVPSERDNEHDTNS
jgi:putative Mg2+ transporter-C (MgtC) family protein